MTSIHQHAGPDLDRDRTARRATTPPVPQPKNTDAANRAVQKIRQSVRLLIKHPGIGRPIEGMPAPFRELVIDFGNSGYLVRYHQGPDRVTLLAVRHQKETGY